jgi:predicted Rossmann fold flavoprotein
MLLRECADHGAEVQLRTSITRVQHDQHGYLLNTNHDSIRAQSVVVACGGLSMPALGATPFGYQLAEQFGHRILPVRAGLVPFTLHDADKQRLAELSGLAVDVIASNQRASFKEAMLFTHRGLSGPAMLQLSSYWWPGETLQIDLHPQADLVHELQLLRRERPKMSLRTALQQWFPKRLALILAEQFQWPDKNLADCNNVLLQEVGGTLHQWTIKPNGSEGYRTAEVTLGGVDTDQVSSKTMESKLQPGLFFIGEVLDVTGWLGGYNFQWAWSSAFACGESV